ncbi:dihydrolipoyl dehydrogenase family protein [Ramlibacter sp.]|uniref:dihydrolipoyl dehydrogenase family protein n=1 Tax=Ramlibacter sp. TaxID=1917967 RepID=UPI003D131A34
MGDPYDLLVIGAGTAAMVASMRARAAGWRVAVVDSRPLGGTCALRGCDPKKMLIGGASAVDHARRMAGKGVAGDARVDWRELMAFKRSFTDPVPGKNEARYADKGIDAFRGHARFTGPGSVEVEGVGLLRSKRFLIASGAEPVRLGIPGEEHLVDNEGFLAMDSMPKRILMVGGGYVAAEFSHIAAVAGSEVTILQHGDRMLKGFDPDLVGWLMPAFEDLGIAVRTSTSVEGIEKTADGFRVRASSGGERLEFDVDLVAHAAGRAPRFGDMNVQAAGIEVENGKLRLNEFLQSVSNPAVYAAGDAAQSGPPLTPVSSHDAKVAADNLLRGNHRRPDYRGVPSVAFTMPPIASVGLGEAQALRDGLKFRMKSELVPNWFTARQAAEKVYGFKVLVDESTDLILGAHLVGPRVDEAINLFALAIRHGLTAEDLKSTMFAYPTVASDIGYML